MISVLYVDDETSLLEIGKLFLERIGTITVDIAHSARDALNRLAAESYDVIVSDYQMPGMDGIELLQKIRKVSDIPFILFTGRSREEVVITALNNGADYYVQKGGNPNAQFAELSHDIQQVVKHKGVEAELRREQEFSRALLKNLVIDPDDQHQVETLEAPVPGRAYWSRRSVSSKSSSVSSRMPGRKTGLPVFLKSRNLKARPVGLFDMIQRAVNRKEVDINSSREQEYAHALLDELVIGPEDLYRMGVLPSPVRDSLCRSRYAGSC